MKSLLQQICLLARRWAAYQRVRSELETYNERELNDMGISRADIGRIAREAAALVKPAARTAPAEAVRPAPLPQRHTAYL